MRNHSIFSAFRNLVPLVSCLLAAPFGAQAQIKFTNAFPGTTFSLPVYFGTFPGRAKTYVVLEQHKGQAVLLSQKGSAWVKDTLLKISVNQENEMGLLGIAFHPDFVNNHKYYISYDPPGDYYNIVEERIADNTLIKDSGTKGKVLINIPDKYGNHNGGTVAFGPKDGLLYFGTGDGGDGGDPDGNGQNKNVLLGKMLRIDVDKQDAGLTYGIPASNPFATAGGRKEIFAYGFRNPWKWSFDPLNGDLWVGDVGQNAIEEVDVVTVGGNYGWKVMEGPSGTNNGNMLLPVYSYGRNAGSCIIGGVVFRGATTSKYYGTYFVTDHSSKTVWNLKKNGTGVAPSEEVGTAPTSISSFGTDETGRIYLCGLGNGIIYLMDSPDLAAGTTQIHTLADLSTFQHHRVFQASAGSSLAPEAFSGSGRLQMFSLEGGWVSSLTREAPQLSKDLKTGIYLLRNPQTKGDPDLLMVR